MNLCGVLFVRRGVELDDVIVCHERIHMRQMLEMLVLFFYLWYVLEWLMRLCQYRNAMRAYRNISLEREAYANQSDFGYPNRRRLFAWLCYAW